MLAERTPHRAIGPPVILAGLAIAALVGLVLHVGLGSSVWLSPADIFRELVRGPGGTGDNLIVWQLRLPRAIACLLVGGILGAVGSSFQALFRNPLADPFVVGVSSGAGVGGALALVFGLDAAFGALGSLAMPAAGFLTGLASLALVFALASRHGAIEVGSLLLAGVVTGSLLAAILSLVLLLAGQDTNQVLRWLMGSMHPMFWDRVALLLGAFVIGSAALLAQSKQLNALAVGEDTARRLGVDSTRLRNAILLAGTAMVAVCVGAVGIVGFLGLVAPHIARRLVGVDWRWSLLGSLLTGSVLLLAADALAQRVLSGGEMPVGVVTALLGSPFLLVLLRRSA
ncbi:MAG: iron ABC transporter permease [Fimbriimonas ginsengisoli]|uniref:Iron ABC transporter permease n=1 Tax=Fimbriimonas ginsengisoli TaxID=1005039 RepID=A0A931PU86_FIMGI|nr:iron ABC transporter permease [Fimbriimonas ginsengisoli]